MIFTIFQSVSKAYVEDMRDVFDDITWEDFAQILLDHQNINEKEQGTLYNLVRFKDIGDETALLGRRKLYKNGEWTGEYHHFPNTVSRCKNNLISISGIVLDFDKDQTIEQTITELEGIEYVLYTTFRHTRENHRFRVVIPFSRPLLAEDVAGRQKDIKRLFPNVDNASFSVSQSFYFHSGKEDNIAFHNRGLIIDPYIFEVEEYVPYVDHVEHSKNTPEDIELMIQELKRLYPDLNYETWIRVTWAFCHELGQSEGINLMRQYYPENTQGEYKKLSSTRYTGKKVTIGTIIKMIKDRQGKIKRAGYGELTKKKILKRETNE